ASQTRLWRSLRRDGLPADHLLLDDRDREEQRDRKRRGDHDRRVKQRRTEIVGRVDDQRAKPVARADPFGHDRSDDAAGRGDLQRGEQERQRGGQADLPEDLGAAGRENPHEIEHRRARGLEALHHIHQRRKEADQRRDDDLRRDAVAHQENQDGGDGDDGDRLDDDGDRIERLFGGRAVNEPDGQQDRDNIADEEAKNRFHQSWKEVREQGAGVGLERADDRNRARGHEGRDREAPDDELPKHDTADDGQDRRKIVDEGIEGRGGRG